MGPPVPAFTAPPEQRRSPASGTPAATSDPVQRREKRAVERTARTLVENADADQRGTLKRTPFARLLQRLFAGRKTGSLLLMRDNTKKIVSFVDGYPVSVRSNVLGECLGQILLQQRLISNEALQDSLRRMKAEKRHQGEILVEMGVLSPYNLSRALVEQVEAKLFEIFAWPDGQYMFKEGEAPHGEAAAARNRSPAALILEGIRRHYDRVAATDGAGRLRGEIRRSQPGSGVAPARGDRRTRPSSNSSGRSTGAPVWRR